MVCPASSAFVYVCGALSARAAQVIKETMAFSLDAS